LLSQHANEAIALKQSEASQACRVNRWDAMRWIGNVREECVDSGEHRCW
jgi:hypothetical protein